MQIKFKPGERIYYTGTSKDMVGSGEIVDVLEEMVMGKKQIVYLVSEGNGGQSMKYVPANQIRSLLNG